MNSKLCLEKYAHILEFLSHFLVISRCNPNTVNSTMIYFEICSIVSDV